MLIDMIQSYGGLMLSVGEKAGEKAGRHLPGILPL